VREAIVSIVHSDPHDLGFLSSRWTLGELRELLQWQRPITLPGLWRLLARLGITWKRGRDYLISPDPDYRAKCDYIAEIEREAKDSAGEIVALYLDEMSFYRQPSLSYGYDDAANQPLAYRSYKSNSLSRVIAAIDITSGLVIYHQRPAINIQEEVSFYQEVRRHYPLAETIYVMLDNWPLHLHPNVLVALAEQKSPWVWYHPKNWRTEPSDWAQKRYGELELPIQLISLPTYAPWTNPIEKLWRKLRQEVLHLHRYADDFATLKRLVIEFLDRFAHGSDELLRYVGLLTPD
jgi:transposase